MISPDAAHLLTLASQDAAAKSQALLDWITSHVPNGYHTKFADLGADEMSELIYLKDKDLEDIGLPPIKRRKIFKQIKIDVGGDRLSFMSR
jgi:hypothetical protein